MKRKIYIQILGVLSCLAVVVLHTNGCFWDFSYERYWLTANLIENLCYFAVPIFFMISGATLMDYRKRYSTEEFFKKRFWKTVVPFLIWSVVGIVWMYFNYGEHPAGILDAIQAIGTTKYVYIYWFSRHCFLFIWLCRYCPAYRKRCGKGCLLMLLRPISSWRHYCR